jgi:hypothetical protein
LIRHAYLRQAFAIVALPVAMVFSSFGALLVATVGATALLPASFSLTDWTAITLSPIAAATDPEHSMAFAAAANSLPENNLAMTRHPRRQVGLDNGDRSWQGRSIPVDGYLMKVANRGPRRCNRRGPAVIPTFEDEITPQRTPMMIDG